ncbi:MAG: septal ring lytic transglycosylase RlpA family protein [Aquificaceae bacterium]|nr:septal ring lytic transglycosylase RlpA family protein [Aquificaceae bacterium]MCS7278244.1 septal ring lytic transglycosylase RlpA family protein [Aquificaceae bacterium]MDW8423463.1 septal ring lytic transglycosylase RlpA family protein [Aquificaceae bacterium]
MRKALLLLLMLCFSTAMAQNCKVSEGTASWYGGKFHGRKTSSGEMFNKHKYTAASRDYPIGTYLLVKNLRNGEDVVVLVTDRGPWKKSRIIDLSKAAAEKLGFLEQGTTRVQIMPLFCVVKEDAVGEQEYEEIIKELLNTL